MAAVERDAARRRALRENKKQLEVELSQVEEDLEAVVRSWRNGRAKARRTVKEIRAAGQDDLPPPPPPPPLPPPLPPPTKILLVLELPVRGAF